MKQLFEPPPLPRTRAVLTLVCASAAFLALAGTLSYAAGSPDTYGRAAAGYWARFFAFNLVAFAGAALFGAFPRLALWTVRVGWLVLLALLFAAAWASWQSLREQAGASAFAWKPYLPALCAVLLGLWWKPLDGRG
jgi:hypothetical protein